MKLFFLAVFTLLFISILVASTPMVLFTEFECPFTINNHSWFYRTDGLGDINGDGLNDMIIEGQQINGPLNHVSYYIYLGRSTFNQQPDFILIDEEDFPFIPASPSFSFSSDINGDGIDDIIIAEPKFESAGRVIVYFGGINFDTNIDLIFNGIDYSTITPENMYFGSKINTEGDFNGDGYNDLVIASGHQDLLHRGQVNVFLGGPNIDTISDWSVTGQENCEHFGVIVTSGDINGDGYSDLGVLSWFDDGSPVNIYDSFYKIYFGSDNFDESSDLSGECSNITNSSFFNIANDLNRDGYCDIVLLRNDSLQIVNGSENGELIYHHLLDYHYQMNLLFFIDIFGFPNLFIRNPDMQRYELLKYDINEGLIPNYYIRFSDTDSDWDISSYPLGDFNGDGNEEIMLLDYQYETNYLHYKIFSTAFFQDNIDQLSSPLISMQTCPNPFKDQITISYEHKGVNPIEVSVFNIKGQKVYTLPNGLSFEKQLNVTWNGRDNHHQMVPNGIYFIQIKDSQQLVTKKIIKIK